MTIKDSWLSHKATILQRRKEEDAALFARRTDEDAWMATVDKWVGWLDSMRQLASGVPSSEVSVPAAPPLVAPPAPPVEKPEPPADDGEDDPTDEKIWSEIEVKPEEIVRKLPPPIWEEIQKAAPASGSGVLPIVQAAILVHETGWFTSRLWHESNNPGGVKWSATAERLGATKDAGGVYAKWPTWRAGIEAHAKFLCQARYDGIRKTSDPHEQVKAIHLGEYAELSESWLRDVNAYVDLLLGQHDGPSPHFTWAEVSESNTATANGIDNRVPEALRPGVIAFASGIVEPLRAALGRPMKYGTDWSSWFRCEKLNAAVGGADGSGHLEGRGLDVPRTEEFWKAIRAAKFGVPTKLNVEPDHYDLKVQPDGKAGTLTVAWIRGATQNAWEV